MSTKKPPEICPQCGETVPQNALACPGCGSDHQTGWSEQADSDRLDLPNQEFDYEEFVSEEFGHGSRKRSLHPVWLVTGVLLLLILLWYWVF